MREMAGTREREPLAGEGAAHHPVEVADAALEERRVDAAAKAMGVKTLLHAGHDPDVLLIRTVDRVATEIAEHRQVAAEIEAARDEPDALRAERVDAQVRELGGRQYGDQVRKD